MLAGEVEESRQPSIPAEILKAIEQDVDGMYESYGGSGPDFDEECLRRACANYGVRYDDAVKAFNKFAEGGEPAESELNKADTLVSARRKGSRKANAESVTPPLRNEPSAIQKSEIEGEPGPAGTAEMIVRLTQLDGALPNLAL